MRRHLSVGESTASRHRRLNDLGGVRLGWVVGIFLSSLVVVVTVVVAAAWVLGGRVTPTDPTVQELLPPEPRQDPDTQAGESVTMTSGLQPPAGIGEEFVTDESAVALPGFRKGSNIREIPVESIAAL